MGYIKIVGAGLLVAYLLILGWWVKGWYDDSKLLVGARLELRNEQQRRVQDKVDFRKSLADDIKRAVSEASTDKSVKSVQKTVALHVQPNTVCDLPDDVASQLQHLREGRDVPPSQP